MIVMEVSGVMRSLAHTPQKTSRYCVPYLHDWLHPLLKVTKTVHIDPCVLDVGLDDIDLPSTVDFP